MSTQYTLRAVPDSIDLALRNRSRLESKSLNAVAIEALARGLELESQPKKHTDLDFLVGSWQQDPEFDQAVADFEKVDDAVWK